MRPPVAGAEADVGNRTSRVGAVGRGARAPGVAVGDGGEAEGEEGEVDAW